MKRILILANSASGLYDFRNELILRLMQEDFEVHISLPDEKNVPELEKEGCHIHHTTLDRRGMNPVRDFKLLGAYDKMIRKIRPAVVLSYTIKPNIYGGVCCRWHHIPYIASITGLGSVFEHGGSVQKLVVFLYRLALKGASCIFFQNIKNQQIFAQFGIFGKQSRLVQGSGVNLDRHCYEAYPDKDSPIKFLYVGRIMREKGMDELFYAAKKIKKEHPNVIFELAGYHEEDYEELATQYEKEGIIHLVGYQKVMHPFYKEAWAVVMPSYHEGMSNVVLEAAATGRPVLASDISGCREGVEEAVTGFVFLPRDKDSLFATIQKFLALSYEKKAQMGHKAREKMEQEFDRQQVVNSYMDEIRAALTKGRR